MKWLLAILAATSGWHPLAPATRSRTEVAAARVGSAIRPALARRRDGRAIEYLDLAG
jgi:hypothetical protein